MSAPTTNDSNYLMDNFVYLIFKILSTSLKNETATGNIPIRICIRKIENQFTFTITLETMKLLGNTKK